MNAIRNSRSVFYIPHWRIRVSIWNSSRMSEKRASIHTHTRPKQVHTKYHRVNTTSMRDFARTIIFILHASLIRSLAHNLANFSFVPFWSSKTKISLCVLLQFMMMRWILFISSYVFAFAFALTSVEYIFIFCTRPS